METRNTMKPGDYQALAEFRHQIRKYLRFGEEASRAAGMEPQQQQLLLALKGLPANSPATIGGIAERLQIRHHSAVELADRLEKGKYVRRLAADEDRRQVLLELTAKGEQTIEGLSRSYADELQTLAPALAGSLRRILSTSAAQRKKYRQGL
jgi:DNA-binding MarR family transcriptional regulator